MRRGYARRVPRARALAAVALAAVAAAGCGGSAGEPSAKAAYVARADAVCERIGERTDALPEPRFPEPGAQPGDPGAETFERDQADLMRRGEAILRDGLRDLRAIPAPPGDERRLAALYDELERAIGALAAASSETPGRPDDDPTARFRRDAAAYGLKTCAADGPA
ncbi:MAG: hypothetical protein AVDCRST_MAG30-4351 [uncultured Solirubrobacteraceae bacterium]|uniref:Uncharacterized protein n=1 Tax=uncultured Solirubrobacteraceae bacterium TaxID=1162706 RepID=A0A6J4U144_9ACTN|nr:MAG: hypothetical protein AVDCRST_MAG30-4351 [uncultured Solirubrobacteraceae bacterium]